MFGEKRSNDFPNWNGKSSNISNTGNQTPRKKPLIPLPNQNRRSITPSRRVDKISSSPLKYPLEKAIQKCMKEKSLKSSRITLGKSSRRQADSIIRRGFYEDEAPEFNKRAHTETINFLKKYFDFDSIIPINSFTNRLLYQFQSLWQDQKDDNNIDQILDGFTTRIIEIFGSDGIDPRELVSLTKEDGMIGLILKIFTSINTQQFHYNNQTSHYANSNYTAFSKNPNVISLNKSFEEQLGECANVQHIKNVIQEFMESLYKEMENQIYGKFNVQMKRIVLKYRDAERIVKKVQEKIAMHADIFDAEVKWERKVKKHQEQFIQMKKKYERLEDDLRRQRSINDDFKIVKVRLEEQIFKLKQSNEKYQNILLNRLENNENSFPSTSTLSRKNTSNSNLTDRTQQFMSNQNQNQNAFGGMKEPFQIKIDTHFVQRDMIPSPSPISQPPVQMTSSTTPTPQPFMVNGGYSQYSPIKVNQIESARPSYEGGLKPGMKIGEYTYSPYKSRIR